MGRLLNARDHADGVWQPDHVTRRTDAEMSSALQHICYEVEAMLKATKAIDTAMRQRVEPPGSHLELQLLHTRCLVEFLIEPESCRRKDDMRRSQFAPPWDPAPVESVQRLEQHATKSVVNKHLAHLSWARVSEGTQHWRYPEIATDTLAVFTAWVAHVSAQNEKLGAQLQFQLESWSCLGILPQSTEPRKPANHGVGAES